MSALLTIVVNRSNFQPRAITLPKSDFPKEKYDIFLKNSSEPDANGQRILVQRVIWTSDTSSFYEKTEWSSIAGEIERIVAYWEYEDCSRRPDWCKNAITDGFLDSECVDAGGNETFVVVEQDCMHQ